VRKIAILAVLATMGVVGAAYAQKSPGASEYTPGDAMQDHSSVSGSKDRGASQYTPGHEQKTPGGASELSPGDKMNDRRSR